MARGWEGQIYLDKKVVDTDEAPAGYKAVPKDTFRRPFTDSRNKNICCECDWRKDCCKLHPCMSYDRKDGVGVVFKFKEAT